MSVDIPETDIIPERLLAAYAKGSEAQKQKGGTPTECHLMGLVEVTRIMRAQSIRPRRGVIQTNTKYTDPL